MFCRTNTCITYINTVETTEIHFKDKMRFQIYTITYNTPNHSFRGDFYNLHFKIPFGSLQPTNATATQGTFLPKFMKICKVVKEECCLKQLWTNRQRLTQRQITKAHPVLCTCELKTGLSREFNFEIYFGINYKFTMHVYITLYQFNMHM